MPKTSTKKLPTQHPDPGWVPDPSFLLPEKTRKNTQNPATRDFGLGERGGIDKGIMNIIYAERAKRASTMSDDELFEAMMDRKLSVWGKDAPEMMEMDLQKYTDDNPEKTGIEALRAFLEQDYVETAPRSTREEADI